MILVGQFDSPFVRRVAIALGIYEIEYERRVLSVFQDFDEMLKINPLGKVPTLIFDDDTTLSDSRAIIEYLESAAGYGNVLSPKGAVDHRNMLQIEAIGIGLAEKTYERGIEFSRRSAGTQDPVWVERLEKQITNSLEWLEGQLIGDWYVGNVISRADLAVGVATTYLVEKLPQLFDQSRLSKLAIHRQRCERQQAFSSAAFSVSEAKTTGWRPEIR